MNGLLLKQIACSLMALATVLMSSTGCKAQGTNTSLAGFGSQTTGQAQESTLTSSATNSPGLRDPSKATETAPREFEVICRTTKGTMIIKVHRDWAPNAADRFYNMVNVGYFNDVAIFRAIEGFMFQFGISGDPAVNAKWSEATIRDDPSVGQSNLRGRLSFAQTGRPDSRSTQMFVNLRNNTELDRGRDGGSAFIPFAEIVAGQDVMDQVFTKYGENGSEVQPRYKREGNAYIKAALPKVDRILSIELRK